MFQKTFEMPVGLGTETCAHESHIHSCVAKEAGVCLNRCFVTFDEPLRRPNVPSERAGWDKGQQVTIERCMPLGNRCHVRCREVHARQTGGDVHRDHTAACG